MRILTCALVLSSLACGSRASDDRRKEQDICRRLEARIAARSDAHQVDRARLEEARAAGPQPRGDLLALMPAVYDLVATHGVARDLGARCLSRDEKSPCEPALTLTPFLLEGLDHAFEQLDLLQRGMAGAGPCARRANEAPALSGTSPCAIIAFHLRADSASVASAAKGWPLALEPGGAPAEAARSAAMQVSQWRALIDYGLAVAPACLSAETLATCEKLRDGLHEAGPESLAARVNDLGEAFNKGTPCGAPGVARP